MAVVAAGVPVVDISAWVSDGASETRAATAAQWDRAMTQIGFAQVTGHGVDPALIARTRKAAQAFFAQPTDAKLAHCHGPYGNPAGGYTAKGVEAVGRTLDGGATASPPDLVENYVFRGRREQWGAAADASNLPEEGPLPAHAPGLAVVGAEYFAALEAVMHALNRMSAAALDLPEGFFDPYFDPGECSLRLAHYPPIPEGGVPTGAVRYGAHTDYQGFTILLQDEGDEGQLGRGGLEVFFQGEWVAVAPQPGCFIVNIGDLYEVWTNGRWRSTLHRVTNPPPHTAAAAAARLSLPFFTGPRPDAMIEALPSCVSATNPAKHPPVRALDHLLAKLGVSNVKETETKAVASAETSKI
eukprot:TRINITY_DN44125_c0_g1_i1.p1 TRINITY_DN44125_c0_g1~~TRINITY_DN44125_c0_g1_i1.p1  ORF type:complete len:395 (-),score=60.09 TRINITY_DN44125_c0_g1_i1:309-1376(-)